MAWRGPKYEGEFPTLGWGVLGWTAEYLPSPLDVTKPLIYTDEQAQWILRWYEIDPDTGQFVDRRAVLEMAKGWGKSPMIGSLAIAEFAGPVCFDGWDKAGDPIGVPWGTGERPPAWVQIAAVSEDQTENTYAALYELLTANDHQAAKRLGIDDGRTRLYFRDGRRGRLEPVTASAGSREGQRVTFGVLDETHLWTATNGGWRLAATLRRNAAKMGGRTVETTNAPRIGDKSVAEQSGQEALMSPGIFHYARRPPIEPDPSWPAEKLREALRATYGGAYWIDEDRLMREIRDPATPWEDALQFWFNWRTVSGGRAVDPLRWGALAKPQAVPPGTQIGLGFDGSISQDATFLIGCTATGYSFRIDAWERPEGAPRDWVVPRADVQNSVERAFSTFRVGLMLCDPPKWWTEVESWAKKWGEERVLALETNQPRRFAPIVDRWLTAIREGTHTHDGDPLTAEHVRAAHLRKVHLMQPDDDHRTAYVLVKGQERGRIDGAVADALAYEAAMTMAPVLIRKPRLVRAF